jgi:hypothetical protein
MSCVRSIQDTFVATYRTPSVVFTNTVVAHFKTWTFVTTSLFEPTMNPLPLEYGLPSDVAVSISTMAGLMLSTISGVERPPSLVRPQPAKNSPARH